MIRIKGNTFKLGFLALILSLLLSEVSAKGAATAWAWKILKKVLKLGVRLLWGAVAGEVVDKTFELLDTAMNLSEVSTVTLIAVVEPKV